MKKQHIDRLSICLGLLVMACLETACKKEIQIPPSPPSQITEPQIFTDSSTVMEALAGVYSYSAGFESGFAYSDAYLAQCTGLSSDELSLTIPPQPDLPEFYSYGLTPLDSHVAALWSTPYRGLYTVNAVISNLNASSALSASFKQQVTGEMEVVRALYYFNLVNLFGGMPVVTSTNYLVNAFLSRASVDSVYGQIISDLTDAEQKLTAAYPSSGHARPNLYTASALLSKVYLYRQQWQQAYDQASAVINSSLYSLEPNLDQVFLDGSKEAIWQIPSTGFFAYVDEASVFIPPAQPSLPAFVLTSFLLNAFEPGDQRFQNWAGQTVINNGSGNDTVYYPYKYKNIIANAMPAEDYMVLRLADVYLIRAEASANLGNGAAALTDLNMVRARAGLPPSTANPSSQTAVLNAIMHERQVELFTEWGNRWYDLKRTGMAATVLGAEKQGWQANDALYPVPQTEITADAQMTQNPGY
jgi:hypothetical protein